MDDAIGLVESTIWVSISTIVNKNRPVCPPAGFLESELCANQEAVVLCADKRREKSCGQP